MHRLCIYAKDLAVILGKTPETCNKKMRDIRKSLGKKKDSPLTAKEVADYLEMDLKIVQEVIFLRDNSHV